MADFTFRIDGMDELQRALKRAPEELRRAARNTLNDAARDVQRDFRKTLPGKFVLKRKTFAERAIYFGREDQATKEKLEARLRIQGPGGKVSTLAKFERDPEKVGRNGRMAIPSKDIRTTGGHVAPANRFKNFLPIVQLGGAYTKLRRRRGQLVAGKTLRSGSREVGQRGSFIITTRTGVEALARRQKLGRGLQLLYVFRRTARIPNPLRFEQDGARFAREALPVRATQAIEHALRRAGLK